MSHHPSLESTGLEKSPSNLQKGGLNRVLKHKHTSKLFISHHGSVYVILSMLMFHLLEALSIIIDPYGSTILRDDWLPISAVVAGVQKTATTAAHRFDFDELWQSRPYILKSRGIIARSRRHCSANRRKRRDPKHWLAGPGRGGREIRN